MNVLYIGAHACLSNKLKWSSTRRRELSFLWAWMDLICTQCASCWIWHQGQHLSPVTSYFCQYTEYSQWPNLPRDKISQNNVTNTFHHRGCGVFLSNLVDGPFCHSVGQSLLNIRNLRSNLARESQTPNIVPPSGCFKVRSKGHHSDDRFKLIISSPVAASNHILLSI